MMTREEIEKKIEKLNDRKFWINMVDYWTPKDRDMLVEINRELAVLYAELQEN